MIPILSAMIGWLSIQLSVKLLLARIFPRQRQPWTLQLAQKISTEWFTEEALEQKITDPRNFEKIRPQVEEHIDDFLRQGLPKAFPIISTFIGERTINQLKEIFMKELETIFPVVMKGYVKNLQQDLHLEQMIVDKASSISTATIQRAVYQSLGAHINKAAGLAAGLGLLIGLIQFGIVWFTTR